MIFYGWWIVLACFIIGFYVAGSIFYGFTALIDPIAAQFGWSYTQVSFAASLRGLEMGIFAPIVGILADKYGSRKIILFGLVTMGLGMVMLSQTTTLLTFYTAFVLLSFGAGGCTSVVLLTAVANWFNKRAGLALGITVCGFGASGLMVPGIVWLVDHYDWQTTILVLGLVGWLVCVPLAFVIRDKPEKYGLRPDGDSEADVEADRESGDNPETQISFFEALKDRNYLILTSAEAARFFIVGTLFTHVMPYLGSVGMSRSKAGLIAASVPILSMIGRFGFGVLGDKYEKKYVMASSYFLMTIGLFAFAYIDQTWAIWAFLIFFAPGYGGGMSLRGSMLREYFGAASFGKLLGVILGVASMTGIVGPTLAGYVYDNMGTYHVLWLAFVILNLVGMSIILLIRPVER